MSICDTHERIIGNVTMETRVYEDGYIQATLIDEFGLEIDSMDGHAGDETGTTRRLIEGLLIDQNLDL